MEQKNDITVINFVGINNVKQHHKERKKKALIINAIIVLVVCCLFIAVWMN